MDQERLLEVLGETLDLPPSERSGYLAERYGDEPEILDEIKRLLALEGDTEGFLDRPAIDRWSRERSGVEQIGPYRLVKTLDEGGMGIVYLAEREDDFEKKVAIKVLRAEVDSRTLVWRFRAERQILARLEHPAISRLLDGGSLDDGRPYLVMEYVEGTRVDHYCREHDLGLKQRLELFLEICSAVAYAHRNLIVHRDLKPDNILVTAEGRPKLLDFGIAKLLDPTDTLLSDATATSSRPMTLRYASPEQVLGESITTASDVWALGLLLCELMAGELPFGQDEGPLEVVRRSDGRRRLRLRETPPRRPSRLVDDGAAQRRLSGDLDAIVLRALGRNPSDRYASVERMATDIERYLGNRPVVARQGGWGYHVGKWVRRQPGAVLAVLLIVAASAVSTAMWRQAVVEQRRADRERAVAVRAQTRAERVSEFLKALFQSADPDAAKGGQLMVREVLDAGRQRLAGGLEDEPELEAELAGTLGDVYRDLGLWEEAVELQRRAVRLRRELYPSGSPRLAVALNDLASVLYYMERYGEAERLLSESLHLRRRGGAEPAQIARALNNLASTIKPQGRLDEAAALYAEALEIRESLHGGDHPAVAASLYSLGSLRFDAEDLETAEPLLRRALTIYLAVHGEEHTRVASVLTTLGRLLHARGQWVEAEEVLERALSVRRNLLGEQHRHVAMTREALAAVVEDAAAEDRAGE